MLGHQIKHSMHMFLFIILLFVTLDKKIIFIFVTQTDVGKPNIIFCAEFNYVVSFFLSGKVFK